MMIAAEETPGKKASSRALGVLLVAALALFVGGLLAPLSLESQSPSHRCRPDAHSGLGSRLHRHVITKVVQEHYPAFLACYQRVVREAPLVRAELHFTISASGAVTGAHVDTEGAPALGACMEPVMMDFVFPPPEEGVQTVDFPIAFAPG